MQNDSSRAPLASFDTVDLGEEERTSRGVFQPAAEKLKTNSKHGMDKSIKKHQTATEETVFDECDSKLRKKIGRFLSAKTYKKISEAKGEEKCYEGEKDTASIDNSLDEASPPRNSSDSDSDSSDSDSGYLRSGYVKVENRQSGDSNSGIHVETSYFKHISDSIHSNDSSYEPTPTSSPIFPRVSISTLLGELQNEKIQSKRKALEKKIQRLQVTNTPVERPRSTTPINIHTFDEYVKEFDSPEKRSISESGEKLQIKLPGEEFSHKYKSPRRHKSSQKENLTVFNFNEDQLFSRTKSAVVVQDDGVSPTPSPRRVLLPPSLTPTTSPVLTRSFVQKGSELLTNSAIISENKSSDWVAFDQAKNSSEANDSWFKQDLVNAQLVGDQSAISSSASFSALFGDKPCNNDDEDVLTVNIEEVDGRKVVDIRCQQQQQTNEQPDNKDSQALTNHKYQSTTEPKIGLDSTDSSANTIQEENTFDLIQEIEIEMKKRQSNTPHLENSSCMSSSSS